MRRSVQAGAGLSVHGGAQSRAGSVKPHAFGANRGGLPRAVHSGTTNGRRRAHARRTRRAEPVCFRNHVHTVALLVHRQVTLVAEQNGVTG